MIGKYVSTFEEEDEAGIENGFCSTTGKTVFGCFLLAFKSEPDCIFVSQITPGYCYCRWLLHSQIYVKRKAAEPCLPKDNGECKHVFTVPCRETSQKKENDESGKTTNSNMIFLQKVFLENPELPKIASLIDDR